MERNFFAVTLLAAVLLSLVQQGMSQQQNFQGSFRPLCGPGFEASPHDRICRPWCENGCKNGYCKAPNECACYPGFVRSLNNECVEECPMSCLNGYCDATTNACVCNEGYILDSSGKFCVPKCNSSCDYPRNCTAPNICSCPPLQQGSTANECKPHCDPQCGSGECIGHNKCVCYEGFTLIKGSCQAKCRQPCVYGRCVAPDYCVCEKNWILNSQTQSCEPVCHGCENGECVAPDRCLCNHGYKRVNGTCEPQCSSCSSHSGKCVAPEKCECFNNYISVENGRACKKHKTILQKVINKAT